MNFNPKDYMQQPKPLHNINTSTPNFDQTGLNQLQSMNKQLKIVNKQNKELNESIKSLKSSSKKTFWLGILGGVISGLIVGLALGFLFV